MSSGPKPNIRMTNEQVWLYLREAHTGILTTLRRDNTPITLPLWFVCIDERIYFRSRGKKLERIKNNPVSSFLVEDGERWVDLRAIHMTGRSEVVEPSVELAEAIQLEFDRKYSSFRVANDAMPDTTKQVYSTVTLIRFTPDPRFLTWDNRGFGVS